MRPGTCLALGLALLVGRAAAPEPRAAPIPTRSYPIGVVRTPHGVITPVRRRAEAGDSAAFVIQPDPGYHVARLIVDGRLLPARPRFVFRDVRAAHVLAADFAPDLYRIDLDAGPHGAFSPARARYVLHGRDVRLTIVPQPGFHLESLTVDGAPAHRSEALVLRRVVEPHRVAATFAPDGYLVLASADAHAWISPAGAVAVGYGESRTFTYAADPGDTVRELWVDGRRERVGGSFTFASVRGPHRIEVRTVRHVATVTAPEPGERWFAGEVREIRWQPLEAGLADSAEVSVSLHGRDGPWAPVWRGFLRTGSARWSVADVDCDSLVVRVAAISSDEPPGLDESAGFVSVRSDVADPREPHFHVRAVPSPTAPGPVRIDYALPSAGEAAIEIFTVGGRQVWRRSLGVAPVGERSVTWDGRLASGDLAGPGVYFARLVTANGERRCRLVFRP